VPSILSGGSIHGESIKLGFEVSEAEAMVSRRVVYSGQLLLEVFKIIRNSNNSISGSIGTL
jgi:hypothetical protein